MSKSLNELVTRLICTADSFCSALYLRLNAGWPLAKSSEDVDYTLPIEILPTRLHQLVVQVLLAHAVMGMRPTVEGIRRVVMCRGGFAPEKVLNPYNRDLIDDLEIICGSGASLHHFAVELIELDRERNRLNYLWKQLSPFVRDEVEPMTMIGKPIYLKPGER